MNPELIKTSKQWPAINTIIRYFGSNVIKHTRLATTAAVVLEVAT